MSMIGRVGLMLCVMWAAMGVAGQDETVIRGEAIVNAVEVEVDAQGSNAPTVQVSGNLADSCTEIDEVIQSNEGDTITLTVTTTRPADLMCAQVLGDFDISVPLDTDDLVPGTYTLLVNGVRSTVTIAPPSTDAQGAAPECPDPDSDTVLFRDAALDLCFLYPASYSVDVLDDGSVAISGPFVGGAGASLLIASQPNARTDLEALADDLNTATDTPLSFETVRLGNGLAIVTEDTPSRIASRSAFVLRDGTQYTFTLQPVGTIFPDAAADADRLWTLLLESAVFGAASDSAAFEVAACAMPAADQAAFIGGGLCFVYPAAYDLIEANDVLLVIDGTVTLRIQWRQSPGFTLGQVQESLELTYPNTDLQFETISLGGVEALLTDHIPGVQPSRQAHVLWQDQQYSFTLSPVAGSAAQRAATLWQVITDSLHFVDFEGAA